MLSIKLKYGGKIKLKCTLTVLKCLLTLVAKIQLNYKASKLYV